MASGRASTDFQNSYLSVSPNTNPSVDTDPVSCVIWAFWTDSSSQQPAFSQESGTGTGRSWLLELSNTIQCFIGGGGVAGSTTLTASAWSHWGVSFPGGTGTERVYLNGSSDGSATKTGEAANGNINTFKHKSAEK